MSTWLTIGFITFAVLSVILLVWTYFYSRSTRAITERRFYELLEKNTRNTEVEHSWMHAMIRRLDGNRLAQILMRFEHPETTILLKQAGWNSQMRRNIFYMMTWGAPIVLAIALSVYFSLQGPIDAAAITKILLAAAAGFLLPKFLLRRKAKSRRLQLSREAITSVYLLRLLFEAGLSTEHALRVLQAECRVLAPEFARELTSALRLIDTGMEPSEALTEMAAPLDVNEINDLVAILRQVSRHGGNIRETLIKFAQLMEERQLLALREYVNVLSGKMSLVMMVFLFPALLVFLAGPGFLALAKGLSSAF